MERETRVRKGRTTLLRAVIEVAFIIFLFYSNLLMGEFTGSNGQGKSLTFALHDIFTVTNFAIAMISALIGYAVFEPCAGSFSVGKVEASLALLDPIPRSSVSFESFHAVDGFNIQPVPGDSA
jgi:hypothetical protein